MAKVLVTGGGGFLGFALCRGLLEGGHEVSSYSRARHAPLHALGVSQLQGDLADFGSVIDACEGMDAVFHVGAKAGASGSFRDYFDANVRGTRNVIAGCRMHDVPILIHTSSPSVAHNGHVEVQGGNEMSAPVASRFKAYYPATKAVAERIVLEENGDGLRTIALRPRLIWGPGDNHLLPRLVQRAQSGRLRFVGDGSNRIDTTYIDNAVDAHLKAYAALTGKLAGRCTGKAYFISNGEPKAVADIINALLSAAGVPAIQKQIPFAAAYAIGGVLERIYDVFNLRAEPPMTRFIAEQLATPHWYDIGAARRDFGYVPSVSIATGLERLATWWRDPRRA
ncbi:MAG: NAD-dependent epimerase/dehydratase family protein [Pseudomarimonas sp.]